MGRPSPSSVARSKEIGSSSRRVPRRRCQPVAAYLLAERLRDEGVMLDAIDGPWRVGGRTLGRRRRNDLGLIPLVTNGRTQVMTDTMEHAADLAGFLNWSGVEDLNPIPDLTPPPTESLGAR